MNCLSVGNGAFGFNNAGSGIFQTGLYNCAGGNNASNVNTTNINAPAIGFQSLGADPFVNAAGGNFALNTVSNGGALCRAAGTPGAFPGLATTIGYHDIGAVQSNRAPILVGMR